MPGQRINSKQIQIYLKAREIGRTQETSSAKGGFSVRTGRRIEKGEHQPQKGKIRDWRTREDPLESVWESELKPLLVAQPKLRPMTLWEYLQEKYPGKYEKSVLRTLQRRVRQWKATSGAPKEVMFAQEHKPGELGLSDFTHFKQATITIKGKPFKHLLYHYRLAYSGWQYIQIIQGGESFVALAQGLQNALALSGGSPRLHRTDSLSAAYRNLGKKTAEDLTHNYEGLCQHYQMRPTRNNRGKSHENGSIESPHGHFKRRLHQALLLRKSFDFDSVKSYQQFIDKTVQRLNISSESKWQQEKLLLQKLPAHKFPDYEVISAGVTCYSTITIRCILYTVPSQLIGHRVTIHLYHDHLDVFVSHQFVTELPRIYASEESSTRRARCLDYRHVVDSLRVKPRAFLQCQWQQDLLPNEDYRQIWLLLKEQFLPEIACRLMVESLYIAAKQDKEASVAGWLRGELSQQTLTLIRLQSKFNNVSPPSQEKTVIQVSQHSLSNYDQLLKHDIFDKPSGLSLTFVAQIPATVSYESTVGIP